MLNKYVYYWLMDKQYYIKSQVRKASVPRISRNIIEDLEIKIPPIEVQRQIVNILDKFYLLNEDISCGLPSEIVFRTKQYEYYRDKLLNFRRAENE